MGHTRPAPFVSTKTLAVVMITGIVLLYTGLRGETAPQPSAAQAHAVSGPRSSAAPGGASPDPVRQTAGPAPPNGPTGSRSLSAPIRLRIPAIGVDTPMMELGLDPEGALEVPPADKPNLAGWYADGPAPGESGTAVVAGHVDTPTGRAVFYPLGAVTQGSTVEVVRRDGRIARFAVQAVEAYSKSEFPSRKVYRSTAQPQLRIITCGGGYSKDTGYLGNVVVYASLIGLD
ncbi:sortase (surface protein transpeptidase) [Streptomyces sp. V4I23]|uniref:class F sortase n=1 Tax=Streptomyces sp. V4I23 TaxID=3042282 RepID=UPI0027841230|nr:class F sortase [Streptomyces sp. V4I23]MDQ1009394.1 sortase (surface protein transpeptidase) [Streptomyces sp. V4I23]